MGCVTKADCAADWVLLKIVNLAKGRIILLSKTRGLSISSRELAFVRGGEEKWQKEK